MRRYFAKITDTDGHPDLKESHVEIRNKPFATIEKGEEGVMQLRNLETNESYNVKAIGLGHYDFENQEDYKENLASVVAEKMDEQGLDHNISA